MFSVGGAAPGSLKAHDSGMELSLMSRKADLRAAGGAKASHWGLFVTFLLSFGPVFLHFCVTEGKRAKRMQEMRQYKRRHAMAAIEESAPSHYCSQHPPIIVGLEQQKSFTEQKEGGSKQLQASTRWTRVARLEVGPHCCSTST